MNAVDKGLLSKSLITSTHLNSSFNSLIHERVEWYYLLNCIVMAHDFETWPQGSPIEVPTFTVVLFPTSINSTKKTNIILFLLSK